MSFQNFVYTLVSDYSGCALGTFPNFKEAYECLEEEVNGKVIFDCREDNDINMHFETIEVIPHELWRQVVVRKYSIYRNLLTVFSNDELVNYAMVHQIQEEFKRKTTNAKYKLTSEVM